MTDPIDAMIDEALDAEERELLRQIGEEPGYFRQIFGLFDGRLGWVSWLIMFWQTVVQIDAHSDLRDEYEDSPYSHACIARRLLDDPAIEQVLQLGIRSVCTEEVTFARANPERVRVWYSENVHAGYWQEELRERLAGRQVYLTIDVDGLDPAIVPATGTPEPDGLTWRETLDILRIVAQEATIVGLDCVELAPIAGHHASDFAVAKLVYKAITYAVASHSSSSKALFDQWIGR